MRDCGFAEFLSRDLSLIGGGVVLKTMLCAKLWIC